MAMPKLLYHLTPFAQLEQRAGDQSRITDVIGALVEISDAKIVRLTSKPNPTVTRDIVLLYLTGCLFLVLDDFTLKSK